MFTGSQRRGNCLLVGSVETSGATTKGNPTKEQTNHDELR